MSTKLTLRLDAELIEAAKAYATVEEICTALRDVYGIYEEPAF